MILTCEKCGTEIQEGASFCPKCGLPISVAQIGPVYVPQSAQPPETIPDIPKAAVTQSRRVYAGFWLRAVAYLLDTIFISLVLGLVASFYPAAFFKFPIPTVTSLTTLPQMTVPAIVITILLVWVYYAVFETSVWQATPGKRLLRLYVTDMNGHRLTFIKATIRYFGKVVSGLTFMVGYVLAGFTEKKQALHDILAGSLVLRRP